jgi:succinoglycan biosynthesis transport protein ExoP
MSSEHPVPDIGARQATAREFVAVVFRRKWIIIGLFAATTATVLAIALSTPVTYTSLGKVQIDRGSKVNMTSPYRLITNWEEELATEVQIVRSVPVSERAQRILDQRAAGGDRKLVIQPASVDARVEGTSTVLRIDYTDGDPVVAQKACDAVITAYVEKRREATLSYPKQFFDSEIGKVNDQLAHLEQQRRGYANRAGVFDLGHQRASDISYLANLRQRRNDVAADLAEARSSSEQMEQLSRDPSVDMPIVTKEYENVVVDLKVKILNQESRLVQLRERYREDSPEIVNAMATLESMRTMLKREVDLRLKVSRSRVQMLEARLAPIDREIEVTEQRLATMPNKETTLREMDLEISTLRSRLDELNRNSDQARITERTSSTVKADVLLPAGRAVPNNTRDYVRLALAPAFSILVGFGLAFFIDGLDSRVRTPRDVETALDLPVLASLNERRKSV